MVSAALIGSILQSCEQTSGAKLKINAMTGACRNLKGCSRIFLRLPINRPRSPFQPATKSSACAMGQTYSAAFSISPRPGTTFELVSTSGSAASVPPSVRWIGWRAVATVTV